MLLYRARVLAYTASALIPATSSVLFSEEVELAETVVIASRVEENPLKTAGSSTAITADEFINRGSVDLVDALQREPGVSIPFDFSGIDSRVPFLQGGSNSINIRGLEGDRVSINIDGIRQPEDFLSRSFNGTGGPGRIYFDPAVFAQIEIFKSASSSLYGSDALAGTVLGRTESPVTLLGPELYGKAFRSTTTYASQNQSLNERLAGAIGNGDQAFSFVYSYRLGQENDAEGDLEPNPFDFQSHAAVVKGAFRFGDVVFEPTFDYFYLDSEAQLNSIEIFDPLVGTTLNSETFSERTRTRFSLDTIWTPSYTTSAIEEVAIKAYYQDSRAETLNFQLTDTIGGEIRDRINDIFFDTEIFGLDSKATFNFETGPLKHLFHLGYEFSNSRVTSSLLRTDNGVSETFLGLAPADVLRNGVFISDRITFGENEQFVVTPSLRLEDYRVTPDNTDQFLTNTQFIFENELGLRAGTTSVRAEDYQNFSVAPGLSALYHLTDHLNIFLTTSRGVRNPTAEELVGVFQHEDDFITLPNPDLEEETSWSNELGLQYDDGTKTFELVGYWNFFDDFIFRNRDTGLRLTPPNGIEANPPGILQTQNVGEVEIFGLEAKGSWTLGHDFPSLEGIKIGGSFSIAEGDVQSPTEVAGPLNTVEPWKATSWISYDHPSQRWGINLTATYASGLDESDINAALSNSGGIDETDDYLLVDLLGYVRITDNISLRGGLKNLLDREYVLPSRAVRGSGHNGGTLTDLDNQPGLNGFVALELRW